VIKSQRTVGKRKQRGAALILFILILMGFGAVTLTGLLTSNLSEIERARFIHNKRVLEEAKQSLLMYAYNYPSMDIGRCAGETPDGATTEAGCLAATTPGTWLTYTNLTLSKGPGRLPCPDHNNDGQVDISEDGANCGLVGRFPWDQEGMGFYDARDADGERLWYAVSEEFRNIDPIDPDLGGDVIVNSESGSEKNNITIVDQSGVIQYQGDVNGVAAVIIAPGPPINRDNDGNGSYETAQNRAADPNDPENYLDTFNNLPRQ
jgi:Tfp pilus assembly protein PilX